MDNWIVQVRNQLSPLVSLVGSYTKLSDRENELLLVSVVCTLVTVLFGSLFLRIVFPSKVARPECCVTKYMQQRKGGSVSIPSSMNGTASHMSDLKEIQHQLCIIHSEIQKLKHEREVIDHELIETSTQILQAIGNTFVSMEEMEDDVIDNPPPIVKPVPSRPLAEKPTVILTPAKAAKEEQSMPTQPVLVEQPKQVPVGKQPPAVLPATKTQPVVEVKAPVVVAKPASVQGSSPLGADAPLRKVVPKPASVQASSPVGMQPKQAPVAAPPPVESRTPSEPSAAEIPPSQSVAQGPPKLSALAMARLKREQEQADAKTTQPQQANPSNPFAKAKPGPFGAGPFAK